MAATTMLAVSSVAALLVVAASTSHLQHSDSEEPWIVVVGDTDNSINDDNVYLSSTARTYAKPYQSVYISTPKPLINRGRQRFPYEGNIPTEQYIETNAHQMPAINVFHQKSGTTYIKSKDTITHEVTISSTEAPDCEPCSYVNEQPAENYYIDTNSPENENVKIYPHSYRDQLSDFISTPRVELTRGDVTLEIEDTIPDNEDPINPFNQVFSVQYPYQAKSPTSLLSDKIDQETHKLANQGQSTKDFKDSFQELNENLQSEREKLFKNKNSNENDLTFSVNKVSQPLSSMGNTEHKMNYQTTSHNQDAGKKSNALTKTPIHHPQLDTNLNTTSSGFAIKYSSGKEVSSSIPTSVLQNSLIIDNSKFDQFDLKKPSHDYQNTFRTLKYSHADGSKNALETNDALPNVNLNANPEINQSKNLYLDTKTGYEIKYSNEAFSLSPQLSQSTLSTLQAETFYISSTPESEIIMDVEIGETPQVITAPFKQELNKGFEINYSNKEYAGLKTDTPVVENDIKLIQYGTEEQQNSNIGLHENAEQGFEVNYGSTIQKVQNNPTKTLNVQFGIDNSLSLGKYIASTALPMFESVSFSTNGIKASTNRNEIEELPAPPRIDLEQNGYASTKTDKTLKHDEGKVNFQFGSNIFNTSTLPLTENKIENISSLQSDMLPESPQQLGFGAPIQDGYEIRYSGKKYENHLPKTITPSSIQDSNSPFQDGYAIRYSGENQKVEIPTLTILLQPKDIKSINPTIPGSPNINTENGGYEFKYTSNEKFTKNNNLALSVSESPVIRTSENLGALNGYEINYSGKGMQYGLPTSISESSTLGSIDISSPIQSGYEVKYTGDTQEIPKSPTFHQQLDENIAPATIVNIHRVNLPESLRLNSVKEGGYEVKYSNDETKIGISDINIFHQPDNIMTARPTILEVVTPNDTSSQKGYEIKYANANYNQGMPNKPALHQTLDKNIVPPVILDIQRVNLPGSITLNSLKEGGYEVKYTNEDHKIRMPEMPILHHPDNIITAHQPIFEDAMLGEMGLKIPSQEGYEIKYTSEDFNQGMLKKPALHQSLDRNIVPPILDIQRVNLPGSITLNSLQEGGYEVKYTNDDHKMGMPDMPILHHPDNIRTAHEPIFEDAMLGENGLKIPSQEGYAIKYNSEDFNQGMPKKPALHQQLDKNIVLPILNIQRVNLPGSITLNSLQEGGYEVKYSKDDNKIGMLEMPILHHSDNIVTGHQPIFEDAIPEEIGLNIPSQQAYEIKYSSADYNQNIPKIPVLNKLGNIQIAPPTILDIHGNSLPGSNILNLPLENGYEIIYSSDNSAKKMPENPVLHQLDEIKIAQPSISEMLLPGNIDLNSPGYEIKYSSAPASNETSKVSSFYPPSVLNIPPPPVLKIPTNVLAEKPEYNLALHGGYEVSFSNNDKNIDVPKSTVLGNKEKILIAFPSFLESSTPENLEFSPPSKEGFEIKYSSAINNPEFSTIPVFSQPGNIVAAPPSISTVSLPGFEVKYSNRGRLEEKMQTPINLFGIIPSTPTPLLGNPSLSECDVKINGAILEQVNRNEEAIPPPPTIDIDYVNGKPEILELQQLQEIMSNKSLSTADLNSLNKSKIDMMQFSKQPVIEVHYGSSSKGEDLNEQGPIFNVQDLGKNREYEINYSSVQKNPLSATFDDNYIQSSPPLLFKGPEPDRISDGAYTITYGNTGNEDLQKYMVIPGPLNVDVLSIGGQYHQNYETFKSTQQPLSLNIESSTPIAAAEGGIGSGYIVEYGNNLSNKQMNYLAIPSPPEVEILSLGGLYHQNQLNNGYIVEYSNKDNPLKEQKRPILLNVKETEKISLDTFQNSLLPSHVPSAPTISEQEINGIQLPAQSSLISPPVVEIIPGIPSLPPSIPLGMTENHESSTLTEFKQEIRPSIALPILPTPPSIMEIDKSNVVIKPASEDIIEVQEPNIVLTKPPPPPVITEINKTKIVQPSVEVLNIRGTPNKIIPMSLPSRWRLLQPVRLQNIPLVLAKNPGHSPIDVKQMVYRKLSSLFPSLADCLKHIKAKFS